MPSVPDGPQEDTRPPGFGCTLSYGMLGTTRLWLGTSLVPATFPSQNQGIILAHHVDTWPPAQYGSHWRGSRAGATFNVFVTCISPESGLWNITFDINSSDPLHVGGGFRTVTDFVWQMIPIPLLEGDSPWGIGVVKRIGEWQTPSLIWPGCAFADVV